MDWNELKYHLETALMVCATILGFGLVGLFVAKGGLL